MEREPTLAEELARIVARRYVECGFNKMRAARSLGISLRTMRSYINGRYPSKVGLHTLDTRRVEFERQLACFLANPPQ